MRNVLATIAGIIDAFIIVIIFDFVAHTLYPIDFDFMAIDVTEMGNEINKIPKEKLFIMGFGHFIAFVVGMGLSSIISKTSKVPAIIVSVLLLVGIVFNLFTKPHPLILDYIEITAIVLGFFVGWLVTNKVIIKNS